MSVTFLFTETDDKMTISGSNVPLSAFIIYDTGIFGATITAGSRFNVTTHPNGNILCQYRNSGDTANDTLSVNDKIVFTVSTGQHIPAGKVVDWINDTGTNGDITATSDAFSGASGGVTGASTTTNSGSSSGDPHISPVFNSLAKTYLLPTNNSIYKYFDNMDADERITINAKMWILSNRLIGQAERALKAGNISLYQELQKRITTELNDETPNEVDTSFVKYLMIQYKTSDTHERLILDMETLESVGSGTDEFNAETSSYQLMRHEPELSHISMTDKEQNSSAFNYVDKNGLPACRKGSERRIITIPSEKHGKIIIEIQRELLLPNHRNSIIIRFCDMSRITPTNCCGTLIQIQHAVTVPTLDYIESDLEEIQTTTEKFLTVQEHSEKVRMIKRIRVIEERRQKRLARQKKE